MNYFIVLAICLLSLVENNKQPKPVFMFTIVAYIIIIAASILFVIEIVNNIIPLDLALTLMQ